MLLEWLRQFPKKSILTLVPVSKREMYIGIYVLELIIKAKGCLNT
jgi:hypothetical protein